MNLKICQQCKNFILLPIRYQCLKDCFFSKYKMVNSPLLKETFFKKNYPKECKHKGKRNEKNCEKCKYFKIEQQRYNCKKSHTTFLYLNSFLYFEPSDTCIYKFEQEMATLNEQ